MPFVAPVAEENADGWGPSTDVVAEFSEVPYAPFSKSDKLGCAADWTQTGYGKFGGSACPRARGWYRMRRRARAECGAGGGRGGRRRQP